MQLPAALLERPVHGFNLRSRSSERVTTAQVAGAAGVAGSEFKVSASQSTLAAQLAGKPAVLVFLRHFGCIFCREMVRDIQALQLKNPSYPPVIFFFQTGPEEVEGESSLSGEAAAKRDEKRHADDAKQAEDFFAKYHPQGPAPVAIADNALEFYRAFGIHRGSVGELLGLRSMGAAIRALFKGNINGKPAGDVRVMPGVFVVTGEGCITWAYRGAHAGDHPDFAEMPARVAAAG